MAARAQGTVIAIAGVFVTSAIVATIATVLALGLTAGPPVIDVSDTRDLIGTLVFGGLSLIVLGISFRAASRTMRDDSAGKPQQLLSFITMVGAISGFVAGGWFGYSIHEGHASSNEQIAEMNCDMAIKAINDDERKTCMQVYPECDRLVDESPCGNLDSAGKAAACQNQVRTARASLRRDMNLGRLGSASSAETELLYTCLVDRVISGR